MPGNDTALKPIVRALMSPAFPVLILMVFLAVGFWLRSGLIEEDSRHVRIIFGSLFLLGLLTSLSSLLVHALLRRNQALLKTRKELSGRSTSAKLCRKTGTAGIHRHPHRPGQPLLLYGRPGAYPRHC